MPRFSCASVYRDIIDVRATITAAKSTRRKRGRSRTKTVDTFDFLMVVDRRLTDKNTYEYLVQYSDDSISWQPARNFDDAEQLWEERFELDHIDLFECVRRVSMQGPDGTINILQLQDSKGVWHPIHMPLKRRYNVQLRLAIKRLEDKPLGEAERVPGIIRVRLTRRGVAQCQHDDGSGHFYNFEVPTEGPVAEALAKCLPGSSVEVDKGSWGGVTSRPDRLNTIYCGGSDGRSVMPLLTSIAAPRVPHQSKVDGCVPNALCNSTILSDKVRAIIIEDMPPRFCMENIQKFFFEHRIPLQLHAPKTWYTEYKSDQRLLKLLSYLLLETTRGHYIVNVKEVDGGEQHCLLFDCDGRWVYDSDPRFGEHALPLTQATMELMCIARVLKASKLVPQRSSVHQDKKLKL